MTKPNMLNINITDLVIDLNTDGDPIYARRTKKEIAANAKLKATELEAFGGWDASSPGKVFLDKDKKPHLVAGFSRREACLSLKYKTGWFAEVENDPLKLRTEAIRSNSGTPISPRQMGALFAEMRDGTKDVLAVKVGEAVVPPMTTQEIADDVGLSRQRVDDLIALAEETPEIGELIEAGTVSANVVTRAQQLVKADGKRLEFLKAAILYAETRGRTKATKQDLDAVQASFVPLKASGSKKDAKPAAKANGADTEEKQQGEASGKQEGQSAQGSMDLQTQSTPPKAKPMPVAKVRQTMIDVLQACDDDLEAADAERYAEALIKAGFGIQT